MSVLYFFWSNILHFSLCVWYEWMTTQIWCGYNYFCENTDITAMRAMRALRALRAIKAMWDISDMISMLYWGVDIYHICALRDKVNMIPTLMSDICVSRFLISWCWECHDRRHDTPHSATRTMLPKYILPIFLYFYVHFCARVPPTQGRISFSTPSEFSPQFYCFSSPSQCFQVTKNPAWEVLWKYPHARRPKFLSSPIVGIMSSGIFPNDLRSAEGDNGVEWSRTLLQFIWTFYDFIEESRDVQAPPQEAAPTYRFCRTIQTPIRQLSSSLQCL